MPMTYKWPTDSGSCFYLHCGLWSILLHELPVDDKNIIIKTRAWRGKLKVCTSLKGFQSIGNTAGRTHEARSYHLLVIYWSKTEKKIWAISKMSAENLFSENELNLDTDSPHGLVMKFRYNISCQITVIDRCIYWGY